MRLARLGARISICFLFAPRQNTEAIHTLIKAPYTIFASKNPSDFKSNTRAHWKEHHNPAPREHKSWQGEQVQPGQRTRYRRISADNISALIGLSNYIITNSWFQLLVVKIYYLGDLLFISARLARDPSKGTSKTTLSLTVGFHPLKNKRVAF